MGIYLDNAATSFPKPKEVATAVYDFMVNNGTSSGRGSYKKAMQSDYIVYECRKLIGKLFNFDNPKKVVLTSNVTDSLNIAMRGILKENDHVITSSLEHNAVWRCLKTLERDINIKIDTVECSKDGITNSQDIKKYIKKDTALIVFTQASNVLGTIQPIREIGAIAREHNIPFLVDSAQSAGAMKIDVKEDNIDILAFTGHKSLLGPMGTGGLIINTDIDIKPLKAGGTGGDSAYEYQPDYYPNHLETGTSNVSGIAGLREAIKFLNKDKGMSIEKLPRYYTELERRLEIIKRIHKGCNASDISDMAYELMLDESNIHRDLRIISDGEMSVMGQRVKVEYRKQNDENGEEYILSTAHPLFLVQNLEQIIALLNGLKYSYEIYGYKEYARETAVSIWMQLSDYATNRILNELPKEELKIDINWYKMIADEAEERKRKLEEEEDYIIDSFKTEEFISNLGKNKEHSYLKNLKNPRK